MEPQTKAFVADISVRGVFWRGNFVNRAGAEQEVRVRAPARVCVCCCQEQYQKGATPFR